MSTWQEGEVGGGKLVEVLVVDWRPPPADTSSDEAIATQLATEEAAAALATPAAAPLSPPAPAAGAAGTTLPRQSPQLQSQPQSPEELQLRHDQQLARSVQEEELRMLSWEQRDHLSVLPQLLPQTALERTLSDTLSTLQGVSFTKLVPQVNSVRQQATAAAAAAASAGVGAGVEELSTTGRQRLEARLSEYSLTERRVKGDGACQFRSLSDQLYRTPRLHAFVRECACQQLRAHADVYSPYVPGSYAAYCADMARPAAWGDHVTLQAAADYFGLRICILSSYPDKCFLEIEPRVARTRRVLWLSFWAEVHYNSLYPAEDPPAPLPTDKLFGSRRLHSLLFGAPSPTVESK